jgi:exonuclease SbcC
MQKSYEALYGSFKKYYAAQEGRWDDLDLAFVFCVQPGEAQLDRFCSHVETDVYFCRKFVVPLLDPLRVSLARLPFLPLTPLQGPSIRPPSAQTFLQQCGLPASLAKFIVVQHERSPDDAASAARGELTSIRERTRQLAERIGANKQMKQSIDKQLQELKNERTRLETEIAQFASAASRLAVAVEASDPTPAQQAQDLAIRLQTEVAELERQGQAAGIAVGAAGTAVASARNAVTAKETEGAQTKAASARVEEELSRMRADHRLNQVSLDVEPGALAQIKQQHLEQLEGFKAEAAKAEAELSLKRPEVVVLRQETTTLKTQLAALRTQVSNFQRTITELTAKLVEAKLPADSSEESALALISQQSRLQEQLLSLRDAASSLELAMDAATTAAALTTLRQTVRNREKAVAQETEKRSRHQPWLKYFQEVSRSLSSQQNDAISNFTREYGPRTSVIQRRLRSVYGFDDIEITSRESAIIVRVKRNGEELRPIDYFSQSQQQTLLLGLFLTACSSQTWSAFSPVFLDDPVTHFDDLNTYAFLDLIVGLIESEPERRQFVISTCDEKLLQLARQKFRRLGERAKFYRFTSFGSSGPTVEEYQ